MAELEIERLVRLERCYRDTQNWSSWRNCYRDDSSKTYINISWFTGEIDDWVEKSKRLSQAGVSPNHTTNVIEIVVSGDRAYSVSVCDITARFDYSGAEFDLIAKLHLVSRVVKTAVGWKLQSLEGIYLQDCIQPVVPLQDPSKYDFDMSRIGHLRASYKCLIWNIERKGMKARRDLPGIDDPQSVQAIMTSIKSWVAETV